MRTVGNWRQLAAWVCVVLLAAFVAGCDSNSSDDDETSGNTGGNGSGESGTGNEAPLDPAALIRVLSNRADLISGGDALVEVVFPAEADMSAATILLNDQNVTSAFAKRADGRYMGLVTGMMVGDNLLTVRIPGHENGNATITNYPNGGPVFSGPQLLPWLCRNGSPDPKCEQDPEYSYFYKSTDSNAVGLQPYDPANPATDVAQTTTDDGVTLPFIVRVETGYQDRDQYRIAVLYQPDEPWTALEPQPQFNHKLVINHGHGCGVEYQSAGAPTVLPGTETTIPVVGVSLPANLPIPVQILVDATEMALGRGFAVMSTALNNASHNCNIALQAESLVMAKERVIEQYGELRYTIGQGCSGGSLTQQWVANAYPGIYQGILPTCSFPDAWSTATQFADYHLLLAYFQDPSKWGTGVVWLPTQMADVQGHVSIVNSIVSDQAQFHVAVPTHACGGVSDSERYHPTTNPDGVRCSVQDAAINIFGHRPEAIWSEVERELGRNSPDFRGFAGFPVDNVGVQYGLKALQAGTITPAQFVDLNVKIGGLDVDTNPIPGRTPAVQPALANAYKSGMINVTNNLNRTAIIDCRGPDPGAFHDSYRAFAVRARLEREHGHHDNQLIWEGPAPILGDNDCAKNSFIAMDRWLAEVEKDQSLLMSLPDKIVAHKPADLGDQCYNGLGQKLSDGLCPKVTNPDTPALSIGVVPVYATPRMMAGDAITTDTNKCQLEPLDRASYTIVIGGTDTGIAIPFTDAEWAQLVALFDDPGTAAIDPMVCDFDQPGVSQAQRTIPWQTYQNSAGGVIYGGITMSAAPENSGGGWASPAFLPAFLSNP